MATLRSIRLGKGRRASRAAPGLVTLRTGLTLPATIERCDGGNVRFRSPLLTKPVSIPLRYVQAVRFGKPAKEDGGFAGYVAKPKEDNDLVYIRGDAKILQFTVTIDRFADGKVYYEVRGRERELEVTRLYGVVMARGSGMVPDGCLGKGGSVNWRLVVSVSKH